MENIGMFANIATIVAAIAAIIAIIVTVKSLRTSIEQFNEQLQLSVFTDYTKRYQEIMLNLPESINKEDFDFDKLDEGNEKTIKEKTLRYMRAYFDLCSEEYFLHGQGKIGDNTWREWKSGIEYAFSKTAFIAGWGIISLDTSYYPDFVRFVEEVMIKKHNKSSNLTRTIGVRLD
ncbi:MAG: hypothetical protein ABW148_05845 [Sedimenticola sp.]